MNPSLDPVGEIDAAFATTQTPSSLFQTDELIE